MIDSAEKNGQEQYPVLVQVIQGEEFSYGPLASFSVNIGYRNARKMTRFEIERFCVQASLNNRDMLLQNPNYREKLIQDAVLAMGEDAAKGVMEVLTNLR